MLSSLCMLFSALMILSTNAFTMPQTSIRISKHHHHSITPSSLTKVTPYQPTIMAMSANDDSPSIADSDAIILGAAGTIASVICGYSLYVLKTTSCGLPPGPFGLEGNHSAPPSQVYLYSNTYSQTPLCFIFILYLSLTTYLIYNRRSRRYFLPHSYRPLPLLYCHQGTHWKRSTCWTLRSSWSSWRTVFPCGYGRHCYCWTEYSWVWLLTWVLTQRQVLWHQRIDNIY
jgi:hypothetical protein